MIKMDSKDQNTHKLTTFNTYSEGDVLNQINWEICISVYDHYCYIEVKKENELKRVYNDIDTLVIEVTELMAPVRQNQIQTREKSPKRKRAHGKNKRSTASDQMRFYRANLTDEVKEKVRERSRIQTADRRASMSDIKKQEEREKDRIRKILKRKSVTEEQRQHNREQDRTKKAALRAITQAINCSICDICFDGKRKLAQHMTLHSGEEPSKGSICDKSFHEEIYLKDHMRKHTGEKPFLCSFCGKGFTTKADLVIHTRIHSGKKPYQCRFFFRR